MNHAAATHRSEKPTKAPGRCEIIPFPGSGSRRSFADAEVGDSELLEAYSREGAQWAFAQLVRRYESMVIGVALRRLGDQEEAKDVAQEVFRVLARKAGTLNGRTSIAGWLHKAAKFQADRTRQADNRRRARYDRLVMADEAAVLSEAPHSYAIVDDALQDMSDGDRDILVLHFYQQLDYRELSNLLDVAEPALRQRVSRALHRLERRLKQRGIVRTAAAALASAAAFQSTEAASAGLVGWNVGNIVGGSLFSALTTHMPLAARAAAVVAVAVFTLLLATSLRLPVERTAPAEVDEGGDSSGFAEKPAPSLLSAGAAAANHPREEGSRAAGGVGEGVSAFVATRGPGVHVAKKGPRVPLPIAEVKAQPESRKVPAVPEAKVIPQKSDSKAVMRHPAVEVELPDELAEIAATGGVSAAIEQLHLAELSPGRAEELYVDLLDQVLSLTPVERLRITDVLADSLDQLREQGIAGLKPAGTTDQLWKAARKEVLAPVSRAVGEIVSDSTNEVRDADVPAVVDTVMGLATGAVEDVLNVSDSGSDRGVTGAVDAVVSPVSDSVAKTLGTADGTASDLVKGAVRVLLR